MESFKIVGLIGFFLGLVSLALPWFEISSIVGQMTFYGFSGDPVISFILLAISLGLLFTKPKTWKVYVVCILALLSLIIAAATIANVTSVVEAGVGIFFTIGPGGPLMIIACLAVLLAGILLHKSLKSKSTP